MRISNFKELKEAVIKLPPVSLSVAAAQDEEVIKSLKRAVENNFIGSCFLAGDKEKIEKLVKKTGFPAKNAEILE
ncbi:phosphate butyryltransferase, partial [candidate division WOR-3 bacterium]|nr:phosphate butyryltransferase [candidate division WOR-3 bacterium]